MSLTERIDGFQRRHPRSGYPLAVAYKFFDDQGGYLAALMTYYGFVSLFPLLLVFTSVLGFVLHDNPELQARIIDSALSQIPVIGSQLGESGKLSGSGVAVAIGVVTAVYGGLGIAVAAQNAMNIAWTVPRNSRPNPIQVRIKGAMLLSTVGVAIIALTVLNGIGAAIELGSLSHWLTLAGSVLLNTAVFATAFRLGTARAVGLRDVLPGAIVAGIGWQALQKFGSIYVERVIGRASETYGVFAVVLGLLAFLYLASVLIVVCLELNVVRVDKLYPRSLLTPFTDNVVLTAGDKAAYTAQARAQRSKGFEKISVSFDKRAAAGDPGTSSDTRPATPGDPTIRRAGVSDAGAVSRLLYDFNTEFHAPTPTAAEFGERFRILLDRDDVVVLLAEQCGAVGFALITLRPTPYGEGSIAQLEELYVQPDLRDQGVGAALLDEALAAVTARGALEMHINVDEIDVEARRFYERHGFVNIEPGADHRMLCYLRAL